MPSQFDRLVIAKATVMINIVQETTFESWEKDRED